MTLRCPTLSFSFSGCFFIGPVSSLVHVSVAWLTLQSLLSGVGTSMFHAVQENRPRSILTSAEGTRDDTVKDYTARPRETARRRRRSTVRHTRARGSEQTVTFGGALHGAVRCHSSLSQFRRISYVLPVMFPPSSTFSTLTRAI